MLTRLNCNGARVTCDYCDAELRIPQGYQVGPALTDAGWRFDPRAQTHRCPACTGRRTMRRPADVA